MSGRLDAGIYKDGLPFAWILSPLGGVASAHRTIILRTTVPEMPEQYRRLVERSPDGILVSQHGRLVLANAAALHLCGVAQTEQMLGTRASDLFTPETREAVCALLNRVGSGGPPERIDARIARHGADARDVEI